MTGFLFPTGLMCDLFLDLFLIILPVNASQMNETATKNTTLNTTQPYYPQ